MNTTFDATTTLPSDKIPNAEADAIHDINEISLEREDDAPFVTADLTHVDEKIALECESLPPEIADEEPHRFIKIKDAWFISRTRDSNIKRRIPLHTGLESSKYSKTLEIYRLGCTLMDLILNM